MTPDELRGTYADNLSRIFIHAAVFAHRTRRAVAICSNVHPSPRDALRCQMPVAKESVCIQLCTPDVMAGRARARVNDAWHIAQDARQRQRRRQRAAIVRGVCVRFHKVPDLLHVACACAAIGNNYLRAAFVVVDLCGAHYSVREREIEGDYQHAHTADQFGGMDSGHPMLSNAFGFCVAAVNNKIV